MKRVLFFLLFLTSLFCGGAKDLPANAYVAVNIPTATSATLDGIANYIRNNYDDTESRLWAIYSWEASYLRYNLEKRDVQLTITNADALAKWTLKHREGVCANFAALFYAVATRLGIETYMVGGYTVNHSNVRDDGHEWCACIIDGKPYMFDPTWGGGYMLNDAQYVHHLKADFFMVEPEKMVRTHMPEDPLFQFLDYPHFYDDIDNPGAVHTIPVYFNWKDTLAVYNTQDTLARLGGKLNRMKANGFANDWIKAEINRYQHNYEAYMLNRQVDAFNRCVIIYKSVVNQATGRRKVNDSSWRVNLQSLRDSLADIIDVLDNTDFSIDALSDGAANVQNQASQMYNQLPDLEAMLQRK